MESEIGTEVGAACEAYLEGGRSYGAAGVQLCIAQ